MTARWSVEADERTERGGVAMLMSDVEAVFELDDEVRHDVDGFGDGDGDGFGGGHGHGDGYMDGCGDGLDGNGRGDGGFGDDAMTCLAPWLCKGNNNE